MERLTDEELALRWQAGNGGAATVLFERHFASVERFFRNKVCGGHEDLVQKTFLACLESPGRFRDEGLFKTYLLGIAYNLLRAHYRAKTREPIIWTEVCTAAFAPSPSSQVRRGQERMLLLEALRRIPLDAQVLLELYYWEELSARAIGEVLGLTEPNVRNRLRKSKAELEAELGRASSSEPAVRETLGHLRSLELRFSDNRDGTECA